MNRGMAFQRLCGRPLSASTYGNKGKSVGLEGANGSVTTRKMTAEIVEGTCAVRDTVEKFGTPNNCCLLWPSLANDGAQAS
jgi:hypothetical protein